MSELSTTLIQHPYTPPAGFKTISPPIHKASTIIFPSMAALRSRGVAVEYHCYSDERHGFRQAAHLAHALEAELGFYRQLLSS